MHAHKIQFDAIKQVVMSNKHLLDPVTCAAVAKLISRKPRPSAVLLHTATSRDLAVLSMVPCSMFSYLTSDGSGASVTTSACLQPVGTMQQAAVVYVMQLAVMVYVMQRQ